MKKTTEEGKLAKSLAKAPSKKIAKRCVTALNKAFCSDGFVNQGKYIIDKENFIAFHEEYRIFISGFLACANEV